MHYYALHEEAYQKLRAQGHESWDQFLGQSGSFEAFGYKEFLIRFFVECVVMHMRRLLECLKPVILQPCQRRVC